MSEKAILVTGAAGLIGSAVVRELNRQGYRNLILTDHLESSDKWMNLRSLSFAEYLEKDELLDALARNDLVFAGLRTIIHLGACSSTTEADASYLIRNNYRYSIRLAQFALLRGIRMCYASSAATYGDGSSGYEDTASVLSSLRPLNPYGYSKHLFDLYLNNRGFAPHFAGIKYFNVYGPNEYHKGDMQSLVLKGFRQINETGRIRLFKSHRSDYAHGEQERDFLYVEDAAKMTVFLALKTEACGLFNAGSGRAETWRALANALFEALGKKPAIEFIDMPDFIRDKYQYHTCAPIQKLREAGCTEPIRTLRDGILDYVKRYLTAGERRA